MWKTTELFVISDLHINCLKDRGMFQADRELSSFLDWFLTNTQGTILVIAGDFLDFLVPGSNNEMLEDFEPQASVQLVQEIIDSHSDVFDALAKISKSEKHKLIILSGNHDYELILPQVRECIQERLGGIIRWLVHGEAARIQIEDFNIVVEHGDLYDVSNKIDRGELRKTASQYSRGVGGKGFKAPMGTYFVKRHVHRLRQDFEALEFLKPELETMFAIYKHKMGWSEISKFKDMALPYAGKYLDELKQEILFQVAPSELTADDNDEYSLAWLTKIIQGEITENEIIKKIAKDLWEISRTDKTFEIQEPDANKRMASYLLKQNINDILIHGHLHAAKVYPVEQKGKNFHGLYFNSGSWTKTIALPRYEKLTDWCNFVQSLLDNNIDQKLFQPYSFVHIRKENQGIQAALCYWRDGKKDEETVYYSVKGQRTISLEKVE